MEVNSNFQYDVQISRKKKMPVPNLCAPLMDNLFAEVKESKGPHFHALQALEIYFKSRNENFLSYAQEETLSYLKRVFGTLAGAICSLFLSQQQFRRGKWYMNKLIVYTFFESVNETC